MKEKLQAKNRKQQETEDHFKKSEPVFMNEYFCSLLRFVNYFIAFYIFISLILYLSVHFLGKDFIKSKKTLTEYDKLLFLNLFYDIFLAFSIFVSYLAISKKSIIFFALYFKIMVMACFFGFYGVSQDMENLNSKIRYAVIAILGINIVFALYPVFHYLRKIRYFRISLEDQPLDNIYHEIRLRTDMMKIGFNHIIIKMKLHKIFPNITFKKEDYYFLSEECRNRTTYVPLSKDDDEKTTHHHYNKMNNFESGSTADEGIKTH